MGRRKVSMDVKPELVNRIEGSITGMGYRGFSSKKKRIKRKVAKKAVAAFIEFALLAAMKSYRG